MRHADLHAHLLGKRPHQPRVFLKHSPDDGQIETFFHKLIGLFAACDAADGADGEARTEFFFHGFGEGLFGGGVLVRVDRYGRRDQRTLRGTYSLVPRSSLDFLERVQAAGADVQKINSPVCQDFS